MLSYKEKHHIANKEAAWSIGGVGIIALAWVVGGFALKDLEIYIAGIPLWVICGTVGTWMVSMVVVVFLSRRIFTDMSFEEDEEDMHAASSEDSSQSGRLT